MNISLVCAKPDCTASASMNLPFDPTTERGRDCKLSVYFHATDFDDWYQNQSHERVEWIKVGDSTVKTNCTPQASGCNATAGAALYPCLVDLPLDTLVSTTNSQLTISAKIPDVVDECPHDGNLLSAVPMITCLVAPMNPSPLYGASPNAYATTALLTSRGTVIVPLQCKDPGCVATGNVNLDLMFGQGATNCMMNVTVNQTDFDGDLNVEQIEYVSMNGVNLMTAIAPGKNPCLTAWSNGSPVDPATKSYAILTDSTVAAPVTPPDAFILSFAMKISPHVDECASNGFLLDGQAEIGCDTAPTSR